LEKELQDLSEELRLLTGTNELLNRSLERSQNAVKEKDKDLALQRQDFQLQIRDLTQALAIETKKAKRFQSDGEKLAQDCLKLGGDNIILTKTLREKENELELVFDQCSKQVMELKKLHDGNNELRREVKQRATEQATLSKDLEDTNERLYNMAQKVFNLVATLNEKDAWNQKAELKLGKNKRTIDELIFNKSAMTKRINKDKEVKVKLGGEVKKLQQSTAEFRKSASDYESKYKKQTNSKHKISANLQSKVLKIKRLENQRQQLRGVKENQKRMREQEKDNQVHDNIGHLRAGNCMLQSKIERTEKEKLKLRLSLKDMEREIDGLVKSHSKALKVQEKKLRNDSSQEKGKDLRSNDGLFGKLVTTLKSKSYSTCVEEMLRTFKIDDKTFFSWCADPATLIGKLAERFSRLKNSVELSHFLKRSNCEAGELLELLSETNASLSAELHEMAAAKEKAIMRLAAVMVRPKDLLNEKGVVLSLNDSEVNDREVGALAEAVSQSNNIIRLDLRGNGITSKGFVELVYGALDSSRLKKLNLRGNRINEIGLIDAYRICSSRCDAGCPIEFATEDGARIAVMNVPMSERKLIIDLRANMITQKHLEDLEILLKGVKNTQSALKSESKSLGHRMKVWLRQEKLEVIRSKQEKVERLRSKPTRAPVTGVISTKDILERAQKELELAKVCSDLEGLVLDAGEKKHKLASSRKDGAHIQGKLDSEPPKTDSKVSRKIKKVAVPSGSKLIHRLRKSALRHPVKPCQ